MFSWSFNPVATRWHYNKDISIIIILSVELKTGGTGTRYRQESMAIVREQRFDP